MLKDWHGSGAGVDRQQAGPVWITPRFSVDLALRALVVSGCPRCRSDRIMNTRLLLTLLGLRYGLLWANVRSRAGKFVLFFAGYLLTLLVITFLLLGGLGAAVAGIRAGRAELVARIILAGFFVYAVLASAILGFGVNRAFSDATLRRYPLTATERFVARHVMALLEPLWLFIAALDLGVATGLAVGGVSGPWLGLPAALLLVASNYLVARLLVAVVERVMRTRVGSTVVLALAMLLILIAPALPVHALGRRTPAMPAALALLQTTPPAAAAAAITRPGMVSAAWLLLLVAWCLALGWALVALERRPAASRAVADRAASWDHPCDRVAAVFGPSMAPLVGKTLRYYLRSPQTRLNYPLAPAGVIVIILTMREVVFPVALGFVGVNAFFCSGSLGLNMFGFDRAGFRRYFLLPVSPRRVFTAICTTALVPGTLLIAPVLVLWVVYSPVNTDLRSVVLLASSAVAGLLFFTTLGAWTSLLAPTPIEFDRTWGNKLSFAANAVMVAGIFAFFGPAAILRLLHVDDATLVAHWWVGVIVVCAAAACLLLTLRAGGVVLERRREKMLALIDVGEGSH
jgi:hypothetical protein